MSVDSELVPIVTNHRSRQSTEAGSLADSLGSTRSNEIGRDVPSNHRSRKHSRSASTASAGNALNNSTERSSDLNESAFQKSFGHIKEGYSLKPDPNLMRVKYRWYALALCIGFFMGYFFCLDNPAETAGLLESTFHLTDTEFSLMYSLYGAINIFIPFMVGLNMAAIGPGRCLLACCTVVFVG